MLALVACSDGGATGTLSGRSSSSSLTKAPGAASETPARNRQLAPQVTDPLDAARLVAHPCDSLTADQLDRLGVAHKGNETVVDTDGGKGCDWQYGLNLEWTIQVAFVMPGSRNGLQNEYDQNSAGWFDGGYFVPTSVAGYPGVLSNVSDTRPHGRCDLAVGINDQMLLTTAVTGEATRDNCKAAANVAERVISKIKAGGN
nr:DUF3558 domain-containing protein [Amycolatopsis granulosa]